MARKPSSQRGEAPDVESVIAELKRVATQETLDGMSRFAIPADNAFGVAMRDVQAIAKRIGFQHALAQQLWDSGFYEARLLAAYVDDPAEVGSRQMDQWCRDFDNWAVCDTVCFALFDRTTHAWDKVELWMMRDGEFARRAAYALLWGLSVHDKAASDEKFLHGLQLVERGASDDRRFVKKAVNMALRAIGKRNAVLHEAALATAKRLAASEDATPHWIGHDALRELVDPALAERLARKAAT
jgi:3-methyladenine DNA glycosylase AlkD